MTTDQSRTKGHRLQVTIDDGEVIVRGDKAGLELLAHRCLGVIGKHDPGGHQHFEWQDGTLLEGSVAMVVEYADGDEDFLSQ
jgi:hypothetical protein